MNATNLDAFSLAYVEAALWSSTDNATEQGGEPLDANYTIDDIHPDTLNQMVADCESFQAFGPMFPDHVRAGYDFWLTRNRHGAGYWDGGYEDAYPVDQIDGESDEAY